MSISQQLQHSNLPLVAPLRQLTRRNTALAGGKGANLGELMRAGFQVPPGFVVTTRAYDLWIETNGLQANLQDLLASMHTDNLVSVNAVSQQIRSAFQQASIPEQIAHEILKAYSEIGETAVAVRSSATAEDLPEAAFAGQQETFLNVIGKQDPGSCGGYQHGRDIRNHQRNDRASLAEKNRKDQFQLCGANHVENSDSGRNPPTTIR